MEKTMIQYLQIIQNEKLKKEENLEIKTKEYKEREESQKKEYREKIDEIENELKQIERSKKELIEKIEKMIENKKEDKELLEQYEQLKEKIKMATKEKEDLLNDFLLKGKNEKQFLNLPKNELFDLLNKLNKSKKMQVKMECNVTQANVGDKVKLKYEIMKGESSQKDYIGYYKKTRPNDSSDYYQLIPTGGKKEGEIEINIPNKLGICHFRFFSGKKLYDTVSSSPSIIVGKTVKFEIEEDKDKIKVKLTSLKPSDPVTNWDWIGLYKEDVILNQNTYEEGMFCGNTNMENVFKKPKIPGNYLFKFIPYGAVWSETCSSPLLSIPDEDYLIAETDVIKVNSFLKISWKIISRELTHDDFILVTSLSSPHLPLPNNKRTTRSTLPSSFLKLPTTFPPGTPHFLPLLPLNF
eukprot:TRINITY_DN471_c0_g1_i2.p1 TRINITY_DN471_c0_g1~~TRINITY_DN471_c0_g1_i2.p1  ORF type:complete len:410 (+),score=173.62 TRINITY_DN471_c0_g1_i2:236-1465(+)